ncbi:MAG: 2-oxo acid dehydrogenase subunit E2 [Ignavibacteriaceae bacterium]|nr:2-oxo acid dehydrogenase subunit E2 [Ignavibacteriaceae bacterium]
MKSYKKLEYTRTRIATIDVCEVGRKKHHMKALLELDVTETHKQLKNYRNNRKCKLSFTGWLIKTISKTIEEHQAVHAYLKNKRSAVVFNDIDISIAVETDYNGELVPIPYVIRETNKKDFIQITEEITKAKNQKLNNDDVLLGEKKNKLFSDLYYILPGILRRFIWKIILKYPAAAKKNMGSVMVTSIGMAGKIKGWFIHTSIHPLSFGIGSILKKPAVVNDKIEIREILNMTVLLDHDVIDGIPMTRFIKKLSENIESGLDLS